VLIIVIQRD